MVSMSEQEIADYVASGDPLDKGWCVWYSGTGSGIYLWNQRRLL